jgi:GTPase SAR1 family protein
MIHDELYQLFQENRTRLVNLTKKHIAILEELAMKEEKENIDQLVSRLENEQFKLLVVGEFSRGKSTFINALLRAKEEILPTDILEATAVITEVKFGDEPSAIMHYKTDSILDGKITEEVDYNELKERITFQDGNADEKAKQIYDSPFEKLELFWPLDLCRNGVELIDSPGLNASDIGTQITTKYLNKVDAILFILSCTQLGTSTELKTIETIRDYGFEDIFFVCNYFDAVRGKKDEYKVKESAIKKFESLTQRGGENKGVFFISSRDATEGYQEGNSELVHTSGISLLEQALEQFLSKESGRSKLVSSERVLRGSINQARKIIPEREEMFGTKISELKERYEVADKKLNSMDLEREKIIRKLANFREDIKDLVRLKGRHKVLDVTHKVESWLEKYEIIEPLNLMSWDTINIKNALERVVTEITTYTSKEVETELKSWQTQELEVFLKERLDLIIPELENNARIFVKEIDSIRMGIVYGDKTPNINVTVEEASISPLERILSAAGGWVFGDFGSAILGATFGYKEMLKSLIPQIALVGATTLLVGFNPFILIPVILGGGFVQGLLKMKGMNDKIKRQVGEKYIEELRSSRQPDDMADKVSSEFHKLEDLINKGLKQEIDSIRTQAQSILLDKSKGEAEAEKQLMKLKAIKIELEATDQELNELMRDIS